MRALPTVVVDVRGNADRADRTELRPSAGRVAPVHWRPAASTLESQDRSVGNAAGCRHAGGDELEGHSKGLCKSAISRHCVKGTETAMAELVARSLTDLDVAVLMIDGLTVAGSCVVVALVITTTGTKVPVGLWLGDTENKTVVTASLADLTARGLWTERAILCVIDGAKALAAGTKKVFGDQAAVQQCTLHKRRNVVGHLPKELAASIDERLATIYSDPDADRALAAARRLATELQADHPDAAGSLRRGVEDTLTVRHMGITSARVRALIGAEAAVVERSKFGGLAFLVDGHVAVVASGRGGLMVRVDPSQSARLCARPRTQPFEMRGSQTNGWLRVDGEDLRTKRQLEPRVDRGAAHARSRPLKS